MKLDKKGSAFDISSQMMMWIPRIFFLIIFILVVLSPIGCFSKNQRQQIENINKYKLDLYANIIKNCVESSGLNEISLKECFFKENVAAKVSLNDKSIIINPEVYDEKELCSLNAKCYEKTKPLIINADNEIKIIEISVVLIGE